MAEEDLFLEFCVVLEGELGVFGLEVTATTQPSTADISGISHWALSLVSHLVKMP